VIPLARSRVTPELLPALAGRTVSLGRRVA
jgi:hypothetical protein